jgi:hypothetical protein
MKTLISFILLFVFVANSFSSPLVFRTKITVTEKDAVIASFDAAKYKSIRIVVARTHLADQSIKLSAMFDVFAVEQGSEVILSDEVGYSVVIDTPPAKIVIKVPEPDAYAVYVYGVV